jgi:hypothetical protein
MTCNKPERINDESQDQHLSWLDLVSKECKKTGSSAGVKTQNTRGMAREN